MPTIRQIADEKYYTDLPGGVLESAGRLFKRSVTMYVYPTRDAVSGDVVSVEHAPIPAPWHHLRNALLDMGRVQPIRGYDETLVSLQTPDILRDFSREIGHGGDGPDDRGGDHQRQGSLFGWRSSGDDVGTCRRVGMRAWGSDFLCRCRPLEHQPSVRHNARDGH
ncbi:MAG: hypothetical protein IPI70_15035 [Nitrospira sp.]|nr:hypothetical protein [Nitrospira sp.]